MACKNCSGKFQGRCDCCYLVDNTQTVKEVVFCEKCNAYICKPCQKNWIKRSVAYFIKKLSNAKPLEQPDIVETKIEYEEGNPNEESV